MMKILVQGTEIAVEIKRRYDDDGDVSFHLLCSEGVWCEYPEEYPNSRPIATMGDAVDFAENHVQRHEGMR